MGTPEISVLMPIFQQSMFVRDSLRSILAQNDVVAEIIISDDASSDRTFAIAQEEVVSWLKQYGSNHRILMRQGCERLRRDHLPLLVEASSCDIVFQAHGDDTSHPERARVLLHAFASLPNARLLTSEFDTLDSAKSAGDKEWRKIESSFSVSRYTLDAIIRANDPFLIGCCEAWRKSAVSRFQRLDMMFSACSHDRILPFRAALTGDVGLVTAQLIDRRFHKLAWSHRSYGKHGTFGGALAKVTAHSAMLKDLLRAKQIALINDSLFLELDERIKEHMQIALDEMLLAFGSQTRSGRQMVWIDDDKFLDTLMKQGVGGEQN
jgi:hypothetical protein